MYLSEFDILEPPEHLRPYVRRYFYINKQLDEPLIFDMFPSNSAYFINFFSADNHSIEGGDAWRTKITINGDEGIRATRWNLGGPILKSRVQVEEREEMRMIVCEFTAKGVYQLFNINGNKATDKRFELIEVSKKIEALAQEVFQGDETAEAEQHIEEMNQFLTALSKEARPVDAVVEKAITMFEDNDGIVKVSDIVEEIEIGERQFPRRFSNVVGMSPKKYGQVLQINWALKLMFLDDGATLSDIAHNAGFTDQAHFTNVIKKFFRESPLQFLESNYVEIKAFLKETNHFEAIMALSMAEAKKKEKKTEDEQ